MQKVGNGPVFIVRLPEAVILALHCHRCYAAPEIKEKRTSALSTIVTEKAKCRGAIIPAARIPFTAFSAPFIPERVNRIQNRIAFYK